MRAVGAGRRKILIIEDEPHIVLGLEDALRFEGFDVVSRSNGRGGVDAAKSERPDCILLDLMLPDMNGYQVCETIRRSDPAVPIVMLTARSQEADKIRGLDSGADDYVTKPFSVGELVARIRALFRRLNRPSELLSFKIGETTVHVAAHLLEKDGASEKLSFYEVELLKLLYERQGQPVKREEILERIWGVEANPTNRSIDNFVVKLRKKLEATPNQPEHILTVYGYGYKLVP
ncbi:MAG: response regulator transcription factor [Polyangiaceae bacterium]|nr:response regulator transcription factor [Polyangiaceae bacterium]MCB9605364.1 response regulator transcription factor [Polyangiaceae bacterium]